MSAEPGKRPVFSLILPTHNRPELLREAINSVVEQTFADWELIVVDNASEQPADANLIRHATESRGRVIRQAQNEGGAAAKKTGARAAKGLYLAFLDDDDLLDSRYLEQAHRALQNQPGISALFMGVRWFGEKGDDGQRAQDENMRLILSAAMPECDSDGVCLFDRLALFTALMERIPMPFQRPVVSRQNYLEIGDFRPECLLWDCDWALRALVHGPCALLDKGLYLQRAQRQGYSSRVERWIEQEESKIEMKEHLLQDLNLRSDFRTVVSNALSKDWFSYAWQMQEKGRWTDANHALRRAASYGLKPRILKLYIAGLAKRVFGKTA